jgi:short-subunit dehydrogenase
MMNIVVTGASKGMGRAIAEIFATAGNTLFLCARNEVQLYEAVAAMQTQYPDCTIRAVAADLSSKDGAVAFGNWVLQHNISVDILINNAGQFVPGSIYNEPDGVLEQMLTTNLYSAYHLTRVLLPGMIQQQKGHIFNICSIASLNAYPNGGSYSISKFALMGFSKNLREELKPHNIKVTSVYPGAVYTASWSGSGVAPERIMESADIAAMIMAMSKLSPQAVVEDIVLRPQLGDL